MDQSGGVGGVLEVGGDGVGGVPDVVALSKVSGQIKNNGVSIRVLEEGRTIW